MPSDEHFAWTRITPEGQALYPDEFSMFLVQVKSDTDIGRELLTDPISTLRERIPEMGLGDETDVKAMVLRINAEVPANPRHRSEVWITYPGSTTAVGIQFKYEKDMVSA